MSTHTAFVRAGEHGFTFQLKSSYQASGFDSATMHFTKPDGTVVAKTCNATDGGAGEWGWVVEEGFFDDDPGLWFVRLSVDLGDEGVRRTMRPGLFLVGGYETP